jgi:hypothetical protein
MTDPDEPHTLELLAAYLGAPPEELERDWRRGTPLDAVAARYGRPRLGLEELVATLAPRRVAR